MKFVIDKDYAGCVFEVGGFDMRSNPQRIRAILDDLKHTCNTGLLHTLDEQRIIRTVWQLKQEGVLSDYNLVEIARDELSWGEYGVNFLKQAISVIDVLYPMIEEGDLTL